MASNTIVFEFSAEDRARLDKLIELLGSKATGPLQERIEAQEEPKKPEAVKTPAPEEKPAEKPQEAKKETPAAPDRRTVKSLAVKKIQAGHRDEVKLLIVKYGAEKIDLVPEDRLAEFTAELEQIGA